MSDSTRRDFLRHGSLGLATLGGAGLVLRAEAQPTQASGQLGGYAQHVRGERQAQQPQQANPRNTSNEQNAFRNLFNDKRGGNYALPAKAAPTEDNIIGPYYRTGAPFRAKVTPPLQPGTVLVVSGRVWGIDTRKPLAQAVIDVWQANAKGRYDNDDPQRPPAKDVFHNRARLITDETGYYEFETVHPGAYKTAPDSWRPAHIHYLVRAVGYKQLITQLYFKGDPHNKADEFIKETLIIELHEQKVGTATYETGTFDIVLVPSSAGRQEYTK